MDLKLGSFDKRAEFSTVRIVFIHRTGNDSSIASAKDCFENEKRQKPND